MRFFKLVSAFNSVIFVSDTFRFAACRKAWQEHEYDIAVTSLNSVAEGWDQELTCNIVFRVSFNCVTLNPPRASPRHIQLDVSVFPFVLLVLSPCLENVVCTFGGLSASYAGAWVVCVLRNRS
ncbi:hypothetical protein KSP40_PGU000968 [Platanthera guangdongensis]|uniref:Uncharacterized protein n=1 Tax=Platanthera guangdongensis TaxID=2320717 RepID=A0ABR2MMA7_9ASPA